MKHLHGRHVYVATSTGDAIAIFDTGAYSISRSTRFTRPRSGAYFVTTEGVVETMRRPETIEDVMRMQVWGPPAASERPAVEREASEHLPPPIGLRPGHLVVGPRVPLRHGSSILQPPEILARVRVVA